MVKKYYLAYAVIIAVAAGALIWYYQGRQKESSTLISQVFYQCNGSKTIDASYYKGATMPSPQPGQPPSPTGSVSLILSDGRQLTLPQTISASGIRYANSDESVIFFSKGEGALVLENNQQTYIGCIKVVSDPGGLPEVYESGSNGFSIRYPADYARNDNYQYLNLGPGKEIGGVSFTIPPSVAQGTNLGSDSYISIEEIPQIQDCSARLFLETGADGDLPITAADGDITYSVVSSTDAGAGNRYEETVYAIPGTNPCIAVRYFIHYSVFENYPPGTVKMFDRQALINQFDAIRRTLVVQQ